MKNHYYFEQTHYAGNTAVSIWRLKGKENENLIYYNFHQEIELVRVNTGVLHLFIDEKETVLSEGEIGVVNANRFHYGRHEAGMPCEVSVYVCDLKHVIVPNINNGKLLTALYHGEILLKNRITPDASCYRELCGILSGMEHYWFLRCSAYELKLKALMADMLFLLLNHEEMLVHTREWGSAKSYDMHKKILVLLDYLDSHYQEHISVSELAALLYMGSDNFYKFISSVTGLSPVAFINQFRLNKAAGLLETTNLSVAEICSRTGFSNVSYFIKCFKKTFGCTPGKYTEARIPPPEESILFI